MDDNFEDLPKVDHSEVTIPPLLPILDKREHVECKISIKCALYTIAPLIVKELSKNAGELEWFRKKSPFGHLLDVPSHYQHSSQMMWLLLLRQVKCERRNEMWFVVNGKPIRFSLLEYVLISGLSGSEYPVGYAQQSRSLNFRKRHFPKNTIVSIDDVQAKFLEMSRKNQGEVFNMEKLKMAMLLFASAVLYYGNKFSTGIEHFLLGLVDDIDMFIQFPWGKDSFNFLRKQLVKSLKGKAGKKSSTMSYGGFVFPLAILVYECIPPIADAFAKPRENLESEIPRICRWQMTWKLRQSPSYDDILKTLGQSQNISGLLTPTDEELQMPYMQGFSQIHEEEEEDDEFNAAFDELTRLLVSGHSITWQHDSDAGPSRPFEPEGMTTETPSSVSEIRSELRSELKTLLDEQFSSLESKFTQKVSLMESNFARLESKVDSLIADKVGDGVDSFTMELKTLLDQRFSSLESNLARIESKVDSFIAAKVSDGADSSTMADGTMHDDPNERNESTSSHSIIWPPDDKVTLEWFLFNN